MVATVKNDWVLQPFVRVGIFHLGRLLPPEYKVELLEECPKDEVADEEDTKFNILGANAFLTVDKYDYVIHVNCDDECYYKGVNLIGQSLSAVEALLEYKVIVTFPDIDFNVYDIDELGVTLWVDENDIVKTVDCSRYVDPREV
jgi:hypothetical protein